MLRTQSAARPCTASNISTSPARGPRANGTRRGAPLRRPRVSSTTHHGFIGATAFAAGPINRHHNNVLAGLPSLLPIPRDYDPTTAVRVLPYKSQMDTRATSR